MYQVYKEFDHDWGNYRVLVFIDKDIYDKGNIAWYVRHMHDDDVGIEFVTIDDPVIDILNINKYFRFYIVPSQRKFRHELRQRFKDRTGQDVHIQRYYKIKLCVDRMRQMKCELHKSRGDIMWWWWI